VSHAYGATGGVFGLALNSLIRVVTLNLPAGRFVLFGKTNRARNGDATNCTLNRGGAVLDQAGVGVGTNG
jgi:hypothetical protein